VGGALSGGTDIPPGPVPEQYVLSLIGVPLSPGLAAAITARQAELVTAMGGYVTGRKPLTLLAPGDSAASAFSKEALARLRRIKRGARPARLDPG